MAKSAKSAVAKPIAKSGKGSKESTEMTTIQKAEKSAEFLQDSDDSEDIDMVNAAPRMGESSSDDSEDSEDSAEEEAAVGAQQAQKKTSGSYAPYAPPQGMTKFDLASVKTTVASSPFEWNALAAKPGVELWAIRVPRNFKPSRFADFQPSQDAESSKRGIFGTVQTSKSTYQLRLASTQTSNPKDIAALPNMERDPAARPTLADSLLLPSSTSAKMDVDGIGKGPREQGDSNTGHEAAVKEELGVGKVVAVGGEEMEGLRLVVPDIRRNAMFTAPQKISRHLILAPVAPQDQAAASSDPAFPTFTSESTAPSVPSKRPQPLEKLKYRNLPFGAANTSTMTIIDRVDPQREYNVAQVKRKADEMDVDEVATVAKPIKSSAPSEKKEKKKSRKSEAGADVKEKKLERKEKKSRKSVA
ncbi:hypothetical protein NliqN6_2581 [Naganishia liquefaciens]|uniref:Uncharacterized protein n=1 Tax=Naganishia liquefaciens TaxID=104408 RepID=A0A8H3TU13_9TREE|nr:hypothetical protein NliqN6_2581 [Naganishia liquefaciens]